MAQEISAKDPAEEEATETDNHWSEDRLDRDGDAQLLKSFLRAQWGRNLNAPKPKTEKREALVVNLDAPWGTGKTFFLDRFEHELEPSCVIRINAWENDFGEDPLVAISQPIFEKLSTPKSRSEGKISSKVEVARVALGKILGAGLGGAIRQAGRKAFGEEGVGEIYKAFADIASEMTTEAGDLSADGVAALLNEHAEKKHALIEFREAIAALIGSEDQPYTPPIFVLIDELDRCRPTYAISFLEKIKHIFQIPEFVFVVATDTKQLQKAIKAVYGEEFDSKTYLRRFFRFTYHLPEVTPRNLIQAFIDDCEWATLDYDSFPLADFAAVIGQQFRCSTRDILQALELSYAASTQLDPKSMHLPMLISEAMAYLKLDTSVKIINSSNYEELGLDPSGPVFTLDGEPTITTLEKRRLSAVNILTQMGQFSVTSTRDLVAREHSNEVAIALALFERNARKGRDKTSPRQYSKLVRLCGQFLPDR